MSVSIQASVASTLNPYIGGSGVVGAASEGAAPNTPDLTYSADFTTGSTPAGVTVTRASSAWSFNSAGDLTEFTSNTARLAYDPTTLAAKGIQIEPARTNSVRNNTMVGAGVGTVSMSGNSSTGTGVLPTNWRVFANSTLSTQVTGTGTESGINYVDIRVSGTAANTTHNIFFEGTNTIAATGSASPQTWTASFFIKRTAGATTNITNMSVRFDENTSSSGYVNTKSGTNFVSTINGPTDDLAVARRSHTATTTGATTGAVSPYLAIAVTNAAAIDITIRIGLPQMELGGYVSSPIKTTGSTLTRQRDDVKVTSVTGLNQDEGALVVKGSFAIEAARTQYMASLCGPTSDDIIGVYKGASSTAITAYVLDSTAAQVQAAAVASHTIGTSQFVGIAYKANDCAYAANAGAAVADTTATMPGNLAALYIGDNVAGTETMDGFVELVEYYDGRLTNANLTGAVT